ncbi:MAG TPA: hypothetical protein PLN21_19535 [Gemmatales bacterium]|nr:hypothetical protein [Gemmatales bacterium]
MSTASLYSLALSCFILLPSLVFAQSDADRLTQQEDKELKAMLDEVQKAKSGSNPLNLTDPAIKRQFDLASRVAEYELLKINKAMVEKKYPFDGEFVAFYMSRYHKLFEENAKNAWLLKGATDNKNEKTFFDKALDKTGLKGDKRNTVILSYYHLLYPAERLFYMEIVQTVYKNNEANFSVLPKRMKDWVAERSAMFP